VYNSACRWTSMMHEKSRRSHLTLHVGHKEEQWEEHAWKEACILMQRDAGRIGTR
jgi:hypothetical protein